MNPKDTSKLGESRLDGLPTHTHRYDVCVVGGGMAGLCAAIASARGGAETLLIHDRPVLGGNASSEVRMWICGAHGRFNKETGILEEIQLDNLAQNPSLDYTLWDATLWSKATHEPKLTTLLNCSVNGGEMAGSRLASVRAWQLTTQCWHDVTADVFIDCSGDGILAPITGAAFRAGREACEEFEEDIQPAKPDAKTMGNTLLIQIRRADSPQDFVAPEWAYKFESDEQFKHRIRDGLRAHNFWWIELGGLQDTIGDAEAIRDDLMRAVYGVWDYIKNVSPERELSRNWGLAFVGSLPGKRENRRYVGHHVLTQNDIRAQRAFDDVVAYGGWSMDDHHPAGMLYPEEPTIFHEAPSPYGIPLRCLISRDVPNLLFAGRNISVTHAALSSTRVMGTCAILGQAVGTAAAMALRDGCDALELTNGPALERLQARLEDDDCWLPGRARATSDLSGLAKVTGDGQGLELLTDGHDRDRPDATHAWEGPVRSTLCFDWHGEQTVRGLRIVFDSNLLNDKRMPYTYPQRGDRTRVPNTLVKGFRVEVRRSDGAWSCVYKETNNHRRLVRVPLDEKTDALRVTIDATWGSDVARVFSLEPTDQPIAEIQSTVEPMTWAQRVGAVHPDDLVPPPVSTTPAKSSGPAA